MVVVVHDARRRDGPAGVDRLKVRHVDGEVRLHRGQPSAKDQEVPAPDVLRGVEVDVLQQQWVRHLSVPVLRGIRVWPQVPWPEIRPSAPS